jgi:CYTH domain-containing protein
MNNHVWRVHSFVYDFGRYGVRTRSCVMCSAEQESDEETGKWPEWVGEECRDTEHDKVCYCMGQCGDRLRCSCTGGCRSEYEEI